MTQVKRADDLGTLSDQGTFARLTNARVTVGGRQYKIDSLDSPVYGALTNGAIYGIWVDAPSQVPALLVSIVQPAPTAVKVGEMLVYDSARLLQTEGVTDTRWQSFAPTTTWNTNVTHTGQWRKSNDSLHLIVHINVSGAPNAATLFLDVPFGLTINNTLTTLGNDVVPFGQTAMHETGVQIIPGHATYFNGNQLKVRYYVDTGSVVRSNQNVTNLAPFTFGAGDDVHIDVVIPILEWA